MNKYGNRKQLLKPYLIILISMMFVDIQLVFGKYVVLTWIFDHDAGSYGDWILMGLGWSWTWSCMYSLTTHLFWHGGQLLHCPVPCPFVLWTSSSISYSKIQWCRCWSSHIGFGRRRWCSFYFYGGCGFVVNEKHIWVQEMFNSSSGIIKRQD